MSKLGNTINAAQALNAMIVARHVLLAYFRMYVIVARAAKPSSRADALIAVEHFAHPFLTV